MAHTIQETCGCTFIALQNGDLTQTLCRRHQREQDEDRCSAYFSREARRYEETGR